MSEFIVGEYTVLDVGDEIIVTNFSYLSISPLVKLCYRPPIGYKSRVIEIVSKYTCRIDNWNWGEKKDDDHIGLCFIKKVEV